MTRVEANLLGLEDDYQQMRRKLQDERLENLRLSRAIRELRIEATKRDVSRQRIALLCRISVVIAILILSSCKLFGVI